MPTARRVRDSGLGVLGCLLAFGWTAAGCALPEPSPMAAPAAPMAAPATVTVVDAERELLRTAEAILAIAPRTGEVWPGYWSPEQPFVLYRRDEAVLLVSPEPPPAQFVPLAESALPTALRQRAYLYRGSLPGLEGNYQIDYKIGAIVAPAAALSPKGAGDTLSTLFHEAFHGYQARHFARAGGEAGRSMLAESFVDPALIAAPEFHAMAEVERRMLRVALHLAPHRLAPLLRRYLAVRWQRSRAVPEQVNHEERRIERKEGSAQYVGEQLAALATADAGRVERRLELLLGMPLDSLSGGLPERLIHLRVYGTGAALGVLLDRLEADWKSRLEQGAGFDELLAEAVGFVPEQAPSLAAEALERFGFAEIRARVAHLDSGEALYGLERFYALAPVRFVLEDPEPLRDGRAFVDLDFQSGNQGYFRPAPGIMLVPDARLLSTRLKWGSLVVRDRPILNDMRRPPRIAVTVLLAELPEVNGRRLANGEHRFSRLSIDSQGIELTVDAPTLVRVSDDSMVLKVETPP